MKKKVLVVVYNIERAREHEWLVDYLKADFEIEYALINKPDSYLREYLERNDIKVHTFDYKGKISMPGLIWGLYRLITRNRYHIVHAHLFEATLAGMVASLLAGVKGRLITRHNSDYHHVYFPNAVKYDKLAGRLAHKIIAVSENVRNILVKLEGFSLDKIVLIQHGIDPDEFDLNKIGQNRIDTLRSKYKIPGQVPVIGVVSRFIYWKGLQYIIPAFREVLNKHPDAILVLANAQGPYTGEVLKLLEGIPADSYRLIEFESDMPALYHTFSCFVHTPVSETAEAFGQTYIEALAAGIPSVITKSGVACEYAVSGENCFMVEHKNARAITEAIEKVIAAGGNLPEMIEAGKRIVNDYYRVEYKYQKIKSLYNSIL